MEQKASTMPEKAPDFDKLFFRRPLCAMKIGKNIAALGREKKYNALIHRLLWLGVDIISMCDK